MRQRRMAIQADISRIMADTTTTSRKKMKPTTRTTAARTRKAKPAKRKSMATKYTKTRKVNRVTKTSGRIPRIFPKVMTYIPEDEPNESDVICGRGGKTNNHPGSKACLRETIPRRQRYKSTSTRYQEKNLIAQEVVDNVHGRGGRFVQHDKTNGKWFILPDNIALKKVKQTLRDTHIPKWLDVEFMVEKTNKSEKSLPTRKAVVSQQESKKVDEEIKSTTMKIACVHPAQQQIPQVDNYNTCTMEDYEEQSTENEEDDGCYNYVEGTSSHKRLDLLQPLTCESSSSNNMVFAGDNNDIPSFNFPKLDDMMIGVGPSSSSQDYHLSPLPMPCVSSSAAAAAVLDNLIGGNSSSSSPLDFTLSPLPMPCVSSSETAAATGSDNLPIPDLNREKSLDLSSIPILSDSLLGLQSLFTSGGGRTNNNGAYFGGFRGQW